MRKISNLDDVQIVLNDLLEFKKRIETQDYILNGRRITKLGEGINQDDAVTLSQLPTLVNNVTKQEQHFTIAFSKDNALSSGDKSVPFRVGKDRVGTPTEVWVGCEGPVATPLVINMSINGVNILTTNLTLPASSKGFVSASNFITPIPNLGVNMRVLPVIVTANGTSLVSIGLVVKRVKI